MTKRISLSVENPSGVERAAWPVTQGIPFADKTLGAGTPVRVVDSEGRVLATQFEPLAFWNKDRKFVKWLLVDFQVDLKAAETSALFLEYGKELELIVPPQPIRLEERGNELLLSTGLLEVRFQRGDPDFFAGCRVKGEKGWTDLLRGYPFLHVRDQNGIPYQSSWASDAPLITIEQAGPMRACLCVKGVHATEMGLRFCPYVLRMHAYAGKGDLRFFHTFIFDQNPKKFELSEIGMKFPLDLGRDLNMAFGGEEETHSVGRSDHALFMQSSDQDYAVFAEDRSLGRGTRTNGWASMSGTCGAVVSAVRDCWKEYPKAFLLTQDGMDLQIWPEAYGETLSFRTPFEEPAVFFAGTRDEETVKRLLAERPTAPLNLKSFDIQNEEALLWVEEMIEKYAPNRAASHNDTGTSDGTGAAKTTEFVVRFSSEGIQDQESEALGISVQEPVIAVPDPAYTCATRAARAFYHRGDPRFAEVDRGLDDILELVAATPIERCRLYGMMRYGNMVCSHSAGCGVSYRYYHEKDPTKALRHVGPYNNEANDQIWSVWGNFIRSGERKHFLLASAYSQNIADVCTCHAHPSKPEAVGLMHYHNAHQWSGGHSPSHTLVTGTLLHYYFTGNRRLLEVALETADWAVRWQEPCGIIANRDQVAGALSREFTGPLWSVMEAYQATWEEKYGDLARRSLNWFLHTQETPGTFPISVYTGGEHGNEAWVEPTDKPGVHEGGIYTLFDDGLRLFDSDLLRKTILAEADHILWNTPTHSYITASMAKEWLTNRSKLWRVDEKWFWTQWGGPSDALGTVVSLAYEITGDPVYVAWAKYHVEVYFPDRAERIRNFSPCLFTLIKYGSYLPILMAIVAEAQRKDPEGLARAEKHWRQKRAELGRPLYDGPIPGIPIDQAHFDANTNVIGAESVDIGLPAPTPRPKPISIGVLACEEA
ncbi:MAG: beta-L-arabinofuranosidase domain-containing protein [Candidatus Latescibacterota bacterium]